MDGLTDDELRLLIMQCDVSCKCIYVTTLVCGLLIWIWLCNQTLQGQSYWIVNTLTWHASQIALSLTSFKNTCSALKWVSLVCEVPEFDQKSFIVLVVLSFKALIFPCALLLECFSTHLIHSSVCYLVYIKRILERWRRIWSVICIQIALC